MFKPYPKLPPKPKKSFKPLQRKGIKKKMITIKEKMFMSHSDAVSFADFHFSQFIRLRDSDEKGIVKCITCDEPSPWREVDCGHFMRRSLMATRYDERNAAGQDKICNQFNYGMATDFANAIKRIYGDDVREELIHKSREIKKYTTDELIKIGKIYEGKVIILKKEKNL